MLGEKVFKLRKLNTRCIGYIFLLLPIFKPYFFATIDFLQMINSIWFLGAVMIMCIFSSTVLLKKFSRAIVLPIFGLCFMLVFATWRNGGELSDSLLHIATIIGMSLFTISCYLKGQDRWEDYLHSLKAVVLLYFVLNLFTMFLYPNGIPSISVGSQAQWLYGNDNGIIKLVMPGIFASLLFDSAKQSISLTSLFLIIASMCLYLFHHSYTAFITTFFILAWILFEQILKKRTKLILLGVVGFVVLFEIVVVILGETLGITNFAADLVGLDSTFSNRNFLWQMTILSFANMPFWGYGVQDNRTIIQYIGNASRSHNYFLDTYYLTGIIGLVLLCYFMIKIVWAIIKEENISKIQYVSCGMFIAYLLMLIFEPFYNSEFSLYPIFLIIYFLFAAEKSNKPRREK